MFSFFLGVLLSKILFFLNFGVLKQKLSCRQLIVSFLSVLFNGLVVDQVKLPFQGPELREIKRKCRCLLGLTLANLRHMQLQPLNEVLRAEEFSDHGLLVLVDFDSTALVWNFQDFVRVVGHE